MTGYDVTWTGLDELQKAFVRVGAQVDVAARANVTQGTLILIKDAQANFEGAHKKGRPHVGGSKPNVVTGNLRRSIMADSLRHVGMGEYSQQAGPTMRYGRRVELGLAPTGAYPYFGPAAKQLRDQMGTIATANWVRHIKY